MVDYIKREDSLNPFSDMLAHGYVCVAHVRSFLRNIPAADVVSWEWLKQYANGKRVNFASDFVAEAEREYKGEHQ